MYTFAAKRENSEPASNASASSLNVTSSSSSKVKTEDGDSESRRQAHATLFQTALRALRSILLLQRQRSAVTSNTHQNNHIQRSFLLLNTSSAFLQQQTQAFQPQHASMMAQVRLQLVERLRNVWLDIAESTHVSCDILLTTAHIFETLFEDDHHGSGDLRSHYQPVQQSLLRLFPFSRIRQGKHWLQLDFALCRVISQCAHSSSTAGITSSNTHRHSIGKFLLSRLQSSDEHAVDWLKTTTTFLFHHEDQAHSSTELASFLEAVLSYVARQQQQQRSAESSLKSSAQQMVSFALKLLSALLSSSSFSSSSSIATDTAMDTDDDEGQDRINNQHHLKTWTSLQLVQHLQALLPHLSFVPAVSAKAATLAAASTSSVLFFETLRQVLLRVSEEDDHEETESFNEALTSLWRSIFHALLDNSNTHSQERDEAVFEEVWSSATDAIALNPFAVQCQLQSVFVAALAPSVSNPTSFPLSLSQRTNLLHRLALSLQHLQRPSEALLVFASELLRNFLLSASASVSASEEVAHHAVAFSLTLHAPATLTAVLFDVISSCLSTSSSSATANSPSSSSTGLELAAYLSSRLVHSLPSTETADVPHHETALTLYAQTLATLLSSSSRVSAGDKNDSKRIDTSVEDKDLELDVYIQVSAHLLMQTLRRSASSAVAHGLITDASSSTQSSLWHLVLQHCATTSVVSSPVEGVNQQRCWLLRRLRALAVCLASHLSSSFSSSIDEMIVRGLREEVFVWLQQTSVRNRTQTKSSHSKGSQKGVRKDVEEAALPSEEKEEELQQDVRTAFDHLLALSISSARGD